MTLNTSIVIGRPTPVRELFDFCRALLGTPDDTPVHEGVCDGDYRAGQKEIHNAGGIGLVAWLRIYYGADGPFALHQHDQFCSVELGGKYDTTQEEIDEHAEWVANNPKENGWAAIEVTFDTAYGYRGEGGESCSDLHARLIRAVGEWCDRKHLPWKWQNEFTGEWHDGIDGLAEFGDAFKSTGAQEWFTTKALTAIAAGIGKD